MVLKKTKKVIKKKAPKKKTVVKKTKKKGKAPKKDLIKKPKEKVIGKVVHYFNKAKVAVVRLRAPLSIEEEVRIKGGETDFTQKIKSMEVDKKKIKKAKPRQEVGLKVRKKAREGYKVFKKE